MFIETLEWKQMMILSWQHILIYHLLSSLEELSFLMRNYEQIFVKIFWFSNWIRYLYFRRHLQTFIICLTILSFFFGF